MFNASNKLDLFDGQADVFIKRHFYNQWHMGKQFEKLFAAEPRIIKADDRAQCHAVSADDNGFILARCQRLVERRHIARPYIPKTFADQMPIILVIPMASA